MNEAPFIYKYKLSKKVMSTLNIHVYKIVIRLKSQVLRKEDSRTVADRQIDRHANRFFFAHDQSPWNTGQTRSKHELPR